MYPKLTNIYWLVLSRERATPWSRCAPVPAMYQAGSIPKIKPSGYLRRLLTKFPGRKIEGSGDGCIAYHFIWDFIGFTNWSNCSQFLSPDLMTWPWRRWRFICSILEQNQLSTNMATDTFPVWWDLLLVQGLSWCEVCTLPHTQGLGWMTTSCKTWSCELSLCSYGPHYG